VRLGCYAQVTAGSLSGVFGAGAQADSWTWIDQGLVHFVSSDGHNTARRPVKLRFAYEAIARERGKELAKRCWWRIRERRLRAGRCRMFRRLPRTWSGGRKSDFSFFRKFRRQDFAGCKGSPPRHSTSQEFHGPHRERRPCFSTSGQTSSSGAPRMMASPSCPERRFQRTPCGDCEPWM